MKAHTPGPWRLRKVSNSLLVGIDSSMGFITIVGVEVTKNPSLSEYAEQDIANANLISSAPELLEALELAAKELIAAYRFIDPEKDSSNVLMQIQSVINKAKGL